MKIAVVGSSCSGKTTLARRLAAHYGVPHIELDALHWRLPNWTEPPLEEFRALVAEAIAASDWVADGGYHGKLGDTVLDSADFVVWLDLPFATILRRLWTRTLRRIHTGEELWGGNRETWRDSFLDRDSLFLWIVQTHRSHRRRYLERLDRYEFVHLRSQREVDAWLAQALASTGPEAPTEPFASQ